MIFELSKPIEEQNIGNFWSNFQELDCEQLEWRELFYSSWPDTPSVSPRDK